MAHLFNPSRPTYFAGSSSVISVNGVWFVVLGPGLVGEGEAGACEIRNHRLYGDDDAVTKRIDTLPRDADGMPVVEDVVAGELVEEHHAK